ncbi:MAG TPA: hypothetical protein VGM50_02410 [Gemmatimonadaceae bacterium]|jgi:hypothetical protein
MKRLDLGADIARMKRQEAARLARMSPAARERDARYRAYLDQQQRHMTWERNHGFGSLPLGERRTLLRRCTDVDACFVAHSFDRKTGQDLRAPGTVVERTARGICVRMSETLQVARSVGYVLERGEIWFSTAGLCKATGKRTTLVAVPRGWRSAPFPEQLLEIPRPQTF